MPRKLTEAILDGGVENINFFEGRLLTGRDLREQLRAERRYDRRLGKAVGAGVAWGLEISVFRDGSDNQLPEIDITAGLAINAEGQTIELPQKERIQLARAASDQPQDAGGFRTCTNPIDTLIPNGVGIYVVLVSPASGYREEAPGSGLKSMGVLSCCGTRYDVEGVSFRLEQLFPTQLTGISSAARTELLSGLLGAADLRRRSRLRNIIAHLCYGTEEPVSFAEDPFALENGEAAFLDYGAVDEMRASGTVTPCDVPLAVFYWYFQGIGFLDMWSVRRRPVAPSLALRWPSFSNNRRAAEGEARLIQFQDHLAWLVAQDSNPAIIEARQYLRYLPPAGFLPISTGAVRGVGATAFFNGLNTPSIDSIRGELVLPLADHSFPFPPIDLEADDEILRFEVVENRTPAPGETYPPYLMFAKSSLPYLHGIRRAIHVNEVLLESGGALPNDSPVAVSDLVRGIRIRCDAPVRPATIKPETCFITIELPYPLNSVDRALWGTPGTDTLGATLGATKVILNATVRVEGADIIWTPAQAVGDWLHGRLFEVLGGDAAPVMRLTLKGNFISDLPSSRFLDGEAFGRPQAGSNVLQLILPRSGDGTPGGDFAMWWRMAQDAPPMIFSVNTVLPTTLRSAGVTEKIGDILINATGGRATPAGRDVPRFDIRVRLGFVTNTTTILDAARGLSDVFIVMDSPTTLNTTALNSTPPAVTGIVGGTNYSNGSAPNIFFGRVQSDGEVLFSGVPIDAPGANGTHVLRIKNMRVNASQLRLSSVNLPTQVIATIRISDAAGREQLSAQTVVAFSMRAVEFTIAASRLNGQDQTAPPMFIPAGIIVNRELLSTPDTTNAEINLRLRFREFFPAAFKRLKRGAGDLNNSALRQEEVGWDNSGPGSIPVRTGDPALPAIGAATQATRVMVRFTNIPGAIRFFVTIRDVPCSAAGVPTAQPMARLVTGLRPNGSGSGTVIINPPPGSPQSGGVALVETTVVAGSTTAVWEIVGEDPFLAESFCVGIALAANQSALAGGTAQVEGFFMPISTQPQPAPVPGTPVPRFIVDVAPINAFIVVVLQ